MVGTGAGCRCAPTACGGVVVDSDQECKYHSLESFRLYAAQRVTHWADDCPARGKVGRRPKRYVGRVVAASLRITEQEEEALILIEGSVPTGLRVALDQWMRSLTGTPPKPDPVTIKAGE